MPTLADLAIFDADKFIRAGDAGQRSRTLASVGQRASMGDLRGAEAEAWQGGQPDIASHIHGMAHEDRQQLVEDAARFAMGATTPEQWEQGRSEWQQRGYDLPPFKARQVVIDQAVPVIEQLKLRQSTAAREAKPPHLEELYDETTGQPYKAEFDQATGSYKRVGGTKAPSGTSLTVDPATGAVSFSQGNLKLTEGQSKDTVYVTRATGALPIIDSLGEALTNLPQSVAGKTPIVGNYAKSPKFQQAEQAGKEFLQAILRKDTGAAITPAETSEYGSVYLPAPGDSPELLLQKKASRTRAVRAIAAGMPPAAILAAEKASGQKVPENPAGAPPQGASSAPGGATFDWSPDSGLRPSR